MKSLADFALEAARDAHENHFFSAHGTITYADLPFLVVFDNRPTKNPELRESIWSAFRRRLDAAGIAELASASFPDSGPAQGYTLAAILWVDAGQKSLVRSLLREAVHVEDAA